MSDGQRATNYSPAQRSELARLAWEEHQIYLNESASAKKLNMRISAALQLEDDSLSEAILAALDADIEMSVSRLQWLQWILEQWLCSARLELDSVEQEISKRISPTVTQQNSQHPPRIGEFLICLFVRPDRQEDRLADFAERFQTVWLPRFGTRLAGAVYVAHVLWSGADIVKIMAFAAAADRIIRASGAIADVVERVLRALGW
jgi:hypothetical protein